MPDVTLPTPGEVEEMRERHKRWPGRETHCFDDGQRWPCDAARLLALVDHVESANHENAKAAHQHLREAVEARARLAAVLAECDRLDEDPGEVGPHPLVADRIRRAATEKRA